jgi:RNA polymerase sigma-70 factor (sigma-E family)
MGSRQPGRRAWEEEFIAYYAARGDILRRTAFVLCGDWYLAEDLLQITFTNLYRVWKRIERREVMDQYARRVLLRAFLNERRRPWRREVSTAPDSADLDAGVWYDRGSEESLVLRTALLRLSRQRRAVLVLRFWADLSVEQVAEVLQCPVGTVKSQTARGLAELRAILGSGVSDPGSAGPPLEPARSSLRSSAESAVVSSAGGEVVDPEALR